jgi:hypothetical protein
LCLSVGRFEVLIAITHRPATGFRKSQGRIISRANQVVKKMRQATTKMQLVDCRDNANGHFESLKLGATLRKLATMEVRLPGRGSVLAHAHPRGGRWLAVKGGWGGWVGGSHERSEPALDNQPLTA